MTFHFSLHLDPHSAQNQSLEGVFTTHHRSKMQTVGWWPSFGVTPYPCVGCCGFHVVRGHSTPSALSWTASPRRDRDGLGCSTTSTHSSTPPPPPPTTEKHSHPGGGRTTCRVTIRYLASRVLNVGLPSPFRSRGRTSYTMRAPYTSGKQRKWGRRGRGHVYHVCSWAVLCCVVWCSLVLCCVVSSHSPMPQ